MPTGAVQKAFHLWFLYSQCICEDNVDFTYVDNIIGSAGWENIKGTGETSLYQPWISPRREEQGQWCLPERFVHLKKEIEIFLHHYHLILFRTKDDFISSFASHRRLPLSYETLQRSHQKKPQWCQTLQQQSCLLHKAAWVSTCPEGMVHHYLWPNKRGLFAIRGIFFHLSASI